MKAIKLISIFTALLMLSALATGCTQPVKQPLPTQSASPAASDDTSVALTDMAGREITLSAPAERIVALTASDCEILYAVGAGSTLVGRGEYCNYPAEALEVKSVQSGDETNIEQIIALEPQVVLMSTMAQSTEQIAALENAGIKVVVSDAKTIADVYTAIEMIGELVGKKAEATAVIDGMKKTFADIASKVTGNGEKTVYFEVSPLEYGLWTAGSNTFMDELAAMLGLKNAFSDVDGWAQISEEQVLENDPDYIVTISMYYGDGPTPVDEIMGRTGWQKLKAIKNGAVLNADSDEISRPGPRLADAAMILYSFVYEADELAPAA
ncbi:MAG: ABC transporter substrate-binding protein [Clostridia bacterium]